jgi:hypothetical protein
MLAVAKSWCYFLNLWWDDADHYMEEADATDTQTERISA